MSELLKNSAYKKWLIALKASIKQQQVKATVAVNSQLILLLAAAGVPLQSPHQSSPPSCLPTNGELPTAIFIPH
jgi:hypothetical protein